jgi:hypothetical protein
MVYEMMRVMAGPYICNLVDSYIAHQDVLNSVIVTGGFVWLVYNRKYQKHIKPMQEQKKDFFGMEIPEKR